MCKQDVVEKTVLKTYQKMISDSNKIIDVLSLDNPFIEDLETEKYKLIACIRSLSL